MLDLDIAKNLSWCAFSMVQILATAIIMSQVAWPVFSLFIPVTIMCIWYQVRISFKIEDSLILLQSLLILEEIDVSRM